MEIAQSEGYCSIIVEGDEKICYDALNEDVNSQLWKISSLCWNSKLLSSFITSYSLCWVRREANTVAHSIAKFVVNLNHTFPCNKTFLPSSVLEAWLRDTILDNSV